MTKLATPTDPRPGGPDHIHDVCQDCGRRIFWYTRIGKRSRWIHDDTLHMVCEPTVRVGLTKAQERYLAEIQAKPGRRYNGHARKPLEALHAAGLIRYEFDLRPQANGRYTEVFTCYPT